MEANWTHRRSQLTKRLGQLSTVLNGVLGRVKLLNAIMLPAILFTANYVLPFPGVLKRVCLLQKHFLRHGVMDIDKGRHKMKTTLLLTKQSLGGVGLIDIKAAIHRQAARSTHRWMQLVPSKYKAAWMTLVQQHMKDVNPNYVSPRPKNKRLTETLSQTSCPGALGLQILSDRARNDVQRDAEWMRQHTNRIHAACKESSIRVEGTRLRLTLNQTFDEPAIMLSPDIQRQWAGFQWHNNPLIVDDFGHKLRPLNTVNVAPSTIDELHMHQISPTEYMFTPAVTGPVGGL